MRAHLTNGEVLESTNISEWPVEAQRVLFRMADIADNTLVFEAEVNGETRWVTLRMAVVTFLSFSQEELDLKVKIRELEKVKQTEEV